MYRFLSCHGIQDYPLLSWHFMMRNPDCYDVEEMLKRTGMSGKIFQMANLKLMHIILCPKPPLYMARNFESSSEDLDLDCGEFDCDAMLAKDIYAEMLDQFKVHSGGCLVRCDGKKLWQGNLFTMCGLEMSNRLCVGDHRKEMIREIFTVDETAYKGDPHKMGIFTCDRGVDPENWVKGS